MKLGCPSLLNSTSSAAPVILLLSLLLSGEIASANNSVSSDGDKADASADQYSGMAWLTEQCPGKRTAEQKEDLKACVKWSTGLEHETFLVHSRDNYKEEYVVNMGSVVNQMSRYGRAFGLDRETHSVAVYLEHTGVEFSGRSCAGINEINFKSMAESVSTDHEQLSFDSAFCQVETLDEKILQVISASPNEQSIAGSLGSIQVPRAGMSSQLGVFTRTGGNTYLCSACDECDLKDYTGSYHVSISLPHDPEGWIVYDEGALSEDGSTCSETYVRESDDNEGEEAETPLSVWVEAHQNFANMVQWVEPLFLAVYGASDSEAVCDDGEFVEGSYRTMSSGWGIPGSTDVRTFGDVGTGRFSHTGFDWMLELVNDTASRSGVLGCTAEGMGSDIRTIQSSPSSSSSAAGDLPTCQCILEDAVDASANGTDESGTSDAAPGATAPALPPMSVGHGIEIRVFDNFPTENLKSVYKVVALLAEASRVHNAESYTYDHAGWKASAQAAMEEGWNAALDADYVSGLEKSLGVDLSFLQGNTQAFDVFSELCVKLIEAHKDGFWTGLLLDDVVDVGLVMDNPNRDSWEHGAMDSGVTPAKIRELLNLEELTFSDDVFELAEVRDDVTCGDDIEDLVYLAQTYGMVEYLETNVDGSIKSVGFFPASEDGEISLRSCDADDANSG